MSRGTHTKAASAEQFGKLYWDVDASLAARAILARVEYRCFRGGQLVATEIVEADFLAALGLGRTATRNAIAEAMQKGLITRERSVRGDARGVFVYQAVPRSQTEHRDVRLQDTETFAYKTGDVRQRDGSGLVCEPVTFANVMGDVRKQDFSDPPVEPVEPKTEPEEEQEKDHDAEPSTPTRPDSRPTSPAPRRPAYASPHRQAQASEVHPDGQDPSVRPRPRSTPSGTTSVSSSAPSTATDRLAEREATRVENARKVEQATARMREQFPGRIEPKPGKCPLALWAVVEQHPASSTYATDLHGNWAAKLGQLAAERSLTSDELTGLLDFWESERAKFASPRERDAALDSGAFPAMADLWFFRAAAWVKWALAVVRTPAGERPPTRAQTVTKSAPHNPALPGSTAYFTALRAAGPEFAEGEGPVVDDIPF